MSSCELRLMLDDGDMTYQFGDIVTGTVEVRVFSECLCRKLVLDWEWRTHGRGAVDCGGGDVLMLFQGTWYPGQTYRYPFSFPAPNGPATYHGHNLNVDWYVQVQADIPESRPYVVRQEILLRPPDTIAGEDGDHLMFNQGPLVRIPDAKGISVQISPGGETRWARAACLAVGIALVALGFERLVSEQLNPLDVILGLLAMTCLVHSVELIAGTWTLKLRLVRFLSAVILGVFVVGISLFVAQYSPGEGDIFLGVVLLVAALYLHIQSILQGKLGKIGVEVRPVAVRRGKAMNCRVCLQSRADTRASAVATLLATEYVASSGGTALIGIPRVVYEKSFPLASAGSSGGSLVLNGLLRVPDDAPPSFSSCSNRLSWELALRVGTSALSAWQASYPVTVCP